MNTLSHNLYLICDNQLPNLSISLAKMAFSVSYTPKQYDHERWHKSVEDTTTPFYDWKARCSPKQATFMYSEHVCDDTLRIIFVPGLSLLYSYIDTDPYTAFITTRVVINEQEKNVNIIEVTCDCRDGMYMDEEEYEALGRGASDMLSLCMRYLSGARLYEKITKHMFGSGWTLTVTENAPYVSKEFEDIGDKESVKMHCSTGPWNKTIGTFDMTKEESSAIKIQAAFRGWRARMKYRYNPYTTLGRYCALKLYAELDKP